MQAIRIHQFGGPEVLRVEDVPVPEPAPGEVLIKVEAAGVNFVDVYHRTALYPGQLPLCLGREAAGVVARVGQGVTTCRAGERVVTETARGAYAEYAVAAAERVVPIPDGVTSRQAAAVILQGMTAQYLVDTTYRLSRGDTCLVHAAAGGVGLLLCQIASRVGARVIGTVSTEEKAALAGQAGAHEVILYSKYDFLEETRRLTGGAGVQVVYDSVGRTTFLKSLDALAMRGMLYSTASPAGWSSRSIPSSSTARARSFSPGRRWPTTPPRGTSCSGGPARCCAGSPRARWRCGSGGSSPWPRQRRRTASWRAVAPPARCCSSHERAAPTAGVGGLAGPAAGGAPISAWWTPRGTSPGRGATRRPSTWRGTFRVLSTSISMPAAIRGPASPHAAGGRCLCRANGPARPRRRGRYRGLRRVGVQPERRACLVDVPRLRRRPGSPCPTRIGRWRREGRWLKRTRAPGPGHGSVRGSIPRACAHWTRCWRSPGAARRDRRDPAGRAVRRQRSEPVRGSGADTFRKQEPAVRLVGGCRRDCCCLQMSLPRHRQGAGIAPDTAGGGHCGARGISACARAFAWTCWSRGDGALRRIVEPVGGGQTSRLSTGQAE